LKNLLRVCFRARRPSMIYGVIFDLDNKQKRLKHLDTEASQPDFWQDAQTAQEILKERSRLQAEIDQWSKLQRQGEDLGQLLEAAEEDQDSSMLAELKAELVEWENMVHETQIRTLLSGEHDVSNAIITIHPGAGGTESQDWAEMLLRMYLRWAERRGYKSQIVDILHGEEAGLKSVTFTIVGEYAYGYLRAESGIHRLVRISPFDANRRRHTSFASVFVCPEVDENIELHIEPTELRVDTYRSSGAGGQHVNVTDSAVRITHLPTGIVAQCQNERSQHRNKEMAMKVLRARLYEYRLKERQDIREELEAAKKGIAWGNQIRSYIFQPYQLVKDHRTSLDVGNVSAVMDGDIDPFIEAYLRKKTV
jgi:peptide chain release factor 2